MDVYIRVDLDDEGPVVVKSATGAGVERVRHERHRLEQAVHPGVVAVAPARDDAEVRTRYAGDPVSRWSGSIAAVAGVGAAVAGTLADLHDVGFVHGRLDATHILLGADGRPRLCGLAHPGDADPSDDVAALGQVLDQLVDRARDQRRSLLRQSRRTVAERRALRRVVERATDPVSTRRPTARKLADAIVAAVPSASLPRTPAGPAPAGDRPGTAAAHRHHPDAVPATDHPDANPSSELPSDPDTLDRIWAFADQPPDDERWAAALGAGPPDLPPPPEPHDAPADAPAGDCGEPHLHVADIDTPAWGSSGAGNRRPPPDERHRPPDDDANLAVLPQSPGCDADDLLATREHRAAAGRVSPEPRPPAGDPATDGQRRHGVPLAAGLVAVVVVAGGAVLIGSGGGADTSRPGGSDPPAPPAGCPEPVPPVADVDGDGCPEPLVVDGTTVDAGVAQWSLGQPGDLVTLGDWDCDGEASAALLRPSTGDVFVFSAWAEPDRPVTVRSSEHVDGGVGVRTETGDAGCDRLVVDLAAGGSATVEVPR